MPIHPQIQLPLQAFDRRRRHLLFVRGLCAGAMALLIMAMVMALVDRFVVLSDQLRLIAGLVVYALSFAAVLAMGWLQTLRKNKPQQLAIMLAQRRPDLKHDVLAAVELGEAESSNIFDSSELRDLAQQRVAEQLSTLKPVHVLPWNLLGKWFTASAVVAVIIIVLLCVPSLRMGQLLHRVMVPWSNLARVSALQVQVLAPTPTDGFVPENEPIPVEVQITGGVGHGVVLEVIRPGQASIFVDMSPLKTDHFVADLPVGHEPLEYRVRADDAMTRRMKLIPKPRPQVQMFVKKYELPKYTHMPDRRVDETKGDLESLQSTLATVTLNLDQPVRKASLTITHGENVTEQVMSIADPLHPTIQIPMEAPGQFELNLTSAQTGFENSFKPRYPIRVIPDLPPEITLLEPIQDVIEPPNGSVQIRLQAQDDLGLVDVQCLLSVNRSSWKKTNWVQNISARSWSTDRRLELYDLAVSPGDEVAFKFSVSDIKGQVTTTAQRKITISVPGFDPRRQIVQAARQKAVASVHDLADAIEKARDAAKNVTPPDAPGSNNPSPKDALTQQQALAAAQAAMKKVDEQAQRAWTQIQQSIHAADQDQDATELVALGQVVSRLRHQELQAAPQALGQPSPPQTAANLLENAANKARGVERAMSQANAAAQAQALALDLKNLAQQQQITMQQAAAAQDQSQKAERLAQQQNNILSQAKQAAQKLEALTPQLPPGAQAPSQGVNAELKTATNRLEKSIASKADVNQEMALGQEAQAKLNRTAELAQEVATAVEREAQPARNDLANVANRLDAPLQEALKTPQKNDAAKDANTAASPSAEALHTAAAILQDRAQLQEARRDVDAPLTMDLDRAARAVEAQAQIVAAPTEKPNSASAQESPQKQVEKIADSLRKISAANQIQKAAEATKQIAEREKNEKPQSAAERAQAWQKAGKKIQQLPEAAARAGIDKPLAENFQRVNKELPEIDREMAQRVRPGETKPQQMTAPLERVAQALQNAQEQAQPMLQEARKELAQSAPPVQEAMRSLATEAERLSTQSAQAAAKPTDAANNSASPQAKRIEQDQAKLNAEVEKLTDTLRRDAGEQDPLSTAGRERARDDDDANALLRDAMDRTQTRTKEAANAGEKAQESLRAASTEQKQMASKLNQLADHFENLQKDPTPATRANLRQAEAQLGIDRALEAEQKRLEQLAKAATATDEERRAMLEKELSRDPQMKQALSNLNDKTVERAAKDLQQAAQAEQALKADIARTSEIKNSSDAAINQQVAELGRDVKQFADGKLPGIVEQSRTVPSGKNTQIKAMEASDAGQMASVQLNNNESKNPGAIAQRAEAAAKMLNDSKDRLAAVASEYANANAAAGQRKTQAQKEVAAAEKAVKAMEQKLAQATANNADTASLAPALAEAQENLGELQKNLAKAVDAGEQTKRAGEQASSAAAQANALGQRASALSNDVKKRLEQQQAAFDQAKQQQQAVQDQVNQTTRDLQRAALQEQQLQHSDRAAAIGEQAKRTDATARGEVAQAKAGIEKSPTDSATGQKLQQANEALAKQSNDLEQMSNSPSQHEAQQAENQEASNNQNASDQSASQQEAAALAKAMDAMNQQDSSQKNGESKESSESKDSSQAKANAAQESKSSAAAKAMAQAARERANAQQQARFNNQSTVGGETSFTPTNNSDPAQMPASAAVAANDASWAKLRSATAQQMSVSKRDMVPADYQVLVDRYFRALAERGGRDSNSPNGATTP